MNTPAPAPAKTSVLIASTPTLGSILGAILGQLAATKLHVTDPISAATIVTGVVALCTAVFHIASAKLGVNLG